MKFTYFYLISFLISLGCGKQQNAHLSEVQDFRYQLNLLFADTERSPLKKSAIKTFKGLSFFEFNPAFRVEAVLKLTPDAPVFEMKTTTERLPLYKKYAEASFVLAGRERRLNLFQLQDPLSTGTEAPHLFLPFNDLSNGKSTYGGGRYMNLPIPPAGSTHITIDFNQSYNPYCAYNEKYSCPIPPVANNLDINILAGIKAYKKPQ
ncbi:MAG: DUF1684 domain-containing protein [Lutibacter sp.]|nr:DUF1684 domain-containing protein [Lutibacter sp.]